MEENLSGLWAFPTRILFGPNTILQLAQECIQNKIYRPLVVTDTNLLSLGWVDDVKESLSKTHLNFQIFTDFRSNPNGQNIEQGVDTFIQGDHDGIIAMGGGSALDVGKTIALMAGQSTALWALEDIKDNYTRVDPKTIFPCIAIPTTSGTGSEVGRAAVIVNQNQHRKVVIFHPDMIPNCVIADPRLTLNLPPNMTAATGMDALSHNLEAFFVSSYHPLADGIALEGIRLIKEWLPVAFQDGQNLAARTHLMAASTMGATAFQKGLGTMHALSHSIGALYDLHHGLLNAILMPYVLKFNQKAIEKKSQRIAHTLSLKHQSFQGLLDWILALRQTLNIPHALKDLELPLGNLVPILQLALKDPCQSTNPVNMNKDHILELLENAIKGNI